MPVGAQPTNEFERSLREPLDGLVNEGERLLVFRQHLNSQIARGKFDHGADFSERQVFLVKTPLITLFLSHYFKQE